MFVAASSGKKILYAPDIDNSEILDVITKKEVVHHDEFDQNGDLSIRTEVISTDYIIYRFYFMADMKEAIKRRHKKAVFSLRKSFGRSENGVFQGASTPEELLAAVYSYEQDNKERIDHDDTNGLIYRQNVDMTKVMNNEKINLVNASDLSKFGTIQKVKLVNPKNWKKLKKKFVLAQHPSRTIDKTLIGSRLMKENYARCISRGVDPGKIFGSQSGFNPADPKKKGTYVSSKINTGDVYFDALKSTMMENVLSPGDQPDVYVGSLHAMLSDESSIAVVEEEVNRVMLVPVDIEIPTRTLAGMTELIVTIDCPDRKGIIKDRLVMSVNHVQNIRDYFTPKGNMDVIAASSFMSPDNNVTITVNKNDKNIIGCRVFYRILNDSSPVSTSHFKMLDTLNFAGKNKTSSTFNIGEISDTVVIFRVVPISRSGQAYGNFSSTVLKRGTFVSVSGIVDTWLGRDIINLGFSNGSPNITAVKFIKRDITAKEKHFKDVRPAIPHENEDILDTSSIIGAGFKVSNGGGCSSVDRDVKHDHVYEYKAVVYLKGGVKKILPGSKIQKYVDTFDVIRISHVPPYSRRENSILFNIDFSISSTETEGIMAALAAAGLADLYSSDIATLKSSLHDAVLIGAERLDMVTGETNHIGFFPPGAITDAGGTGTPPIRNRSYKYKFSAYIISPQVALTDLIYENNDPAIQTVFTLQDIKSPRAIQKLREKSIATLSLDTSIVASTAKYVADKVVKTFSTAGLAKGTLISPENAFASKLVIKASPEKFPTGIETKVICETRSGSSIRSGKISSGRGGSILSWSVSSVDSNEIDCFIVLSQKQGRKNIAGTCFKTSGNGYYTFIDHVNKDYVGLVSYTVIPIFSTGIVGEEYLVGSTIMTDKSAKFRSKK